MLAIILILQPLPLVPEPDPPRHVVVDLIIINQYCRTSETADGKLKSDVTWYDSVWNIHYFPPWGVCRIPVFENRGWQKSQPLVRCNDGWACRFNRTLVTCRAPPLIVVSDYDWEYKNRHLHNPVDR